MPREAEAPSAVKVLMRIPDLSQPKGNRPFVPASQPAAKPAPFSIGGASLPLAYLDDVAPSSAPTPPKSGVKLPATLTPILDARPAEPIKPAELPPIAFAGEGTRKELLSKPAGEMRLLDAAENKPAAPKSISFPAGDPKPAHKPHAKASYVPEPEEIVTPDERKRQGAQPLVLLAALAIIITVLAVALMKSRHGRQAQPALNRPTTPNNAAKLHDHPAALPVTVAPSANVAPGPLLAAPMAAPAEGPKAAAPVDVIIERLPPVSSEASPANEVRSPAAGDSSTPGVARLENRIDKTPTDGSHDAPRRRLY